MNDANRVLPVGCRVGRFWLVALLIPSLAFTGCRPAAETSGEAQTVPEKSSAQLMVDGITGKYAVDAGKRAKANIQVISDQHNAALEKVLEE